MSKCCKCKRCLLEVGKTDEPEGTEEIWATQPSCHTYKYLLVHKHEEITHWFYYSSLDYCGIQTRSSAAPNNLKVKLQLWLHPRTEALVCLRLLCSIKYLPAWSPPPGGHNLTDQNILISPLNSSFLHEVAQTKTSWNCSFVQFWCACMRACVHSSDFSYSHFVDGFAVEGHMTTADRLTDTS